MWVCFVLVQEMTGFILFSLPESVPVWCLLDAYEQCVCCTGMCLAHVECVCSIVVMHMNLGQMGYFLQKKKSCSNRW